MYKIRLNRCQKMTLAYCLMMSFEKIEDDAGFCQSQEYPRILLLFHCNGKASLQVYVNILKSFDRAVIVLIEAV